MSGTEEKEIRKGFGEGLFEAAKENSEIIALSADLGESTGFGKIMEELPEHFVECGIAEQNMACVASGLAHEGKLPYISSFAMFSPGRNWEQIRTTICLNNQDVKIISTHAGFSDAPDGATHQALEDIALMRVLPNMSVFSPADWAEAKALARKLPGYKRPAYVRMQRGAFPVIFQETDKFAIGRAKQVRTGRDIAILTTGSMLHNVLKAAERLSAKGIEAEVLHFPTIKPLDKPAIWSAAHKFKKIVTVEEHQIDAGFGSSIAELLSEVLPTPVLRIGVKGEFGESGSYEELLKKHGLDSESIALSVKKFYNN
ncbi:transketolase family protein [Candidatus Saccharibacteria bacterium]|nr:transketolase family protein [Candidatus Saccharibacteria bacterium]